MPSFRAPILGRRSFLAAIAAVAPAWPSALFAHGGTVAAAAPVTREPPIPLDDFPWPDPLGAWLREPIIPVIESDDPLVAALIRFQRAGRPIDIAYGAGSTPGAWRSITPLVVFTKPDYPSTGSPVYLLAWCHARGAARTFRLDRLALATPA